MMRDAIDKTYAKLVTLVEELDDTDYIVRQTILRDLQSKADTCTCIECRKNYSLQIAVCYKFGFGCAEDDAAKALWLEKSGKSEADIDDIIKQIGKSYQGTNRVSDTVLRELGIGVLQTADRPLEYQASGRLAEAEVSLKQEIETRTRAFGIRHIALARLERELAQVLQFQNKNEDAAQHQQHVVEIFSQHHSDNHPSVIMAKLTLAAIWLEQGLLRRAEETQEQNIPLLKELMGEEHPDVLAAMSQQAHAKACSGNHRQAETIYREVLAQRIKVMGQAHPLTINLRLSLVTVLRAQGHITAAADEMEIIDKHALDVIEGDWLRTADIRMSQAQFYADMNLLDRAIECATEARKAIDYLKVEDQHDLSIQERHVRAAVHHTRQEWQAEEIILREIITAIGSESYKAKRAKSLLARNLVWQGRAVEGELIAEETIKSLGPSPLEAAPDTYVSCTNTLADIMLQGRRHMAEEKLTELLELCILTYGDDHPITVDSTQSLAAFWNAQREYIKSQALIEPILSRLRQRPRKSAIQIAGTLTEIYRERGFGDDAIKVCEEAIRWAIDPVGENYTDTLTLRHSLVNCFLQMNRLPEAEELLRVIASQQSNIDLAIEIQLSMARLMQLQGRDVEYLKHAQEAKMLMDSKRKAADATSLRIDGHFFRARIAVHGLDEALVRDMTQNIRLREEILGARHPSRIAMMAHLAYQFGLNGRLKEAEQLINEVETLGGLDESQQPIEYAKCLGKLADSYYRRGQYDKAVELEYRALNIRLRIYQADDEPVLITKANLSSTLNALHRYAEAETHLRDVIIAREKSEMTDRTAASKLAKAKGDLATVLYFQDRFDDSHTLYSEAIQLLLGVNGSPSAIALFQVSLRKVREAQKANGKSEV
jgi:tetratricopeptide (TPR) repeat protein